MKKPNLSRLKKQRNSKPKSFGLERKIVVIMANIQIEVASQARLIL
ncbi:4092_t:CDS:1, partial [Gigaspora rosea]